MCYAAPMPVPIRILLALLAGWPLPALAQAAGPATPPAPAAPGAPVLSDAPFDPAPYLAPARWSDGCYGVTLSEPAGMKRNPGTASWLFQDGQVQYRISASFVLPPPRTDNQRPMAMSLKETQAVVLTNLTTGRAAARPLPNFTRDFLADKHPCSVSYALLQPQARRGNAQAPEAFLIGVGVLQVSPHCTLALTLACRVPTGAETELPQLVDAQRKLEAMLASARTTPESTLAAVREAQLTRGEAFLESLTPERTQAALAAFGPARLLRVAASAPGGPHDIGWMRWEMRHQDAAWYKEHPAAAAGVDKLRQPGVKVTVKSHTQSGECSADTDQSFFYADESGQVLAFLRKPPVKPGAGATQEELLAAVEASKHSFYDAWQRTTTFRSAGKDGAAKPQTVAEAGYLTLLPNSPGTGQLRVEWSGTTPPGLASFFSTNPDWRKKVDQLWDRVETTVKDSDGGLPVGGHPIKAKTDDGKNMNGDLTENKWPIPLDPRRPYLSQAQAALMPWLLPPDPGSYAFCFYSQEARRPGICLFKVAEARPDGSRAVFFRPALDQGEQVFEFDAAGKLRHIVPSPDMLLIPSTTEELSRIWKLGELR